jgi:hypothetical protein
MVKLKLKLKIAGIVLAISLICIILVVVFLIPRGSADPDFLVDGAVGTVRQHGTGYNTFTDFYLTFNVTNNGTATSSNVYGNASYQSYGHLYNATWGWSSRANLTQKGLTVGQKSRAYAIFYDVPTESPEQFTIIVTSAEGIKREFNVNVTFTIP